ncbi:serine proteinase [Histoplasma capsulatum G186AR]|uniref:Serine proteinase n=2 Tax=Ajellomyces capsulatus TaxID=5037 RepID=C0NTY8_AJECG|nr:serine proteinase [Histoplasma capsulatum G186AR]EEH05499.1 serine proteinase [Histoplasma capsulatum G186AR]KAG5305129.1 serine proteinase [Histoplasma capsulatum]QSS76089.1 serine proteinase [Histoplasma capsulatum G186AR]
MKGLLALSIVPLLAAASPVVIDSIHKDAAPILSSVDAKVIEDSYIVVFKKHVTSASAVAHQNWVQNLHTTAMAKRSKLDKRNQFPFKNDVFSGLKHTFDIAGSLLGYSGSFDEEVIDQVRMHPDVDFIEKDSEVHTTALETQNNSPWGLARICHRDTLDFSTFNTYLYSDLAGEGVDIYIIDTGINTEHVDFQGRAFWGATIPVGEENVDGNGHGTHCAGTSAAATFGVAKKANVYAVKVLRSNGSGTMSDVVKGVEYAAQSHQKQMKAAKEGTGRKGFKGSVANMSLGGGPSRVLDLAVNAAVDTGMHFAVAAGNDNADACNYSPAAAESAITVGASTLSDERAFFSNYGPCVDIFAPGLNILSTWTGSKYAVNTISGTSMASPHIAGLAAYFVSLYPSTQSAFAVAPLSPEDLKTALAQISTKDMLTQMPEDTKNLLAWNGGGSSNYSEIVGKGGYNAGSLKDQTKDALDRLEKLATDELHAIYSEIKNAFIL